MIMHINKLEVRNFNSKNKLLQNNLNIVFKVLDKLFMSLFSDKLSVAIKSLQI